MIGKSCFAQPLNEDMIFTPSKARPGPFSERQTGPDIVLCSGGQDKRENRWADRGGNFLSQREPTYNMQEGNLSMWKQQEPIYGVGCGRPQSFLVADSELTEPSTAMRSVTFGKSAFDSMMRSGDSENFDPNFPHSSLVQASPIQISRASLGGFNTRFSGAQTPLYKGEGRNAEREIVNVRQRHDACSPVRALETFAQSPMQVEETLAESDIGNARGEKNLRTQHALRDSWQRNETFSVHTRAQHSNTPNLLNTRKPERGAGILPKIFDGTSDACGHPCKELMSTRIKTHFGENGDCLSILYEEMSYVLAWKDPLLSLTLFLVGGAGLGVAVGLGWSLLVLASYGALFALTLSCVCQSLTGVVEAPEALRRLYAQLMSLESWQRALLLITASCFQLVEISCSWLGASISGVHAADTVKLLAALWITATFGSAVPWGTASFLIFVATFTVPTVTCAVTSRQTALTIHASAAINNLPTAAAVVLVATGAGAATYTLYTALHYLLAHIQTRHTYSLLYAALLALMMCARAQGKSPGRMLVSLCVYSGEELGPRAISMLRSLSSPLKDSGRKS